MPAANFNLHLASGRLSAQAWGSSDDPLVLCVHGLSANMHGFDVIGPSIAERGRRVVAVDLRGRGRSEVTAPGTYGLAAHVDDVLAVATELGATEFAYVGWSMGAMIGILAAAQAPERIRRLALLDAAGPFDPAAGDAVVTGLARLDAVVDDPDTYVDAVRAAGAATPWSEFWERYFRYELQPTPDGAFSPTTSRAACLEDINGGGFEALRPAWRLLTMPTLLVRCLVPLNGGHLVPAAELAALQAAVDHLELVEVDRNHYGVVDDPVAARAVTEFLA